MESAGGRARHWSSSARGRIEQTMSRLMTEALDVLRIISLLPGSISRVRRTYTPAIATPNGIAEYRSVVINGHPQRLLIRGQDVSKPLLLYIPGGPGESNIWAAHRTMRALEAYFVCVNWDPRGAPKSLRPPPPPETMTMDQQLSDAITVMELMLRRFAKQKLLLIGHSWGSTLAMKVAAVRPDLLYAVVGMGQEVDRERGEALSYQYVLEHARGDGNRKAIRELEELGGSDTFGKSGRFVERLWLMHYGGVVHSGGLLQTIRVLLEATEYSIVDCIRYARMEGTAFCIPLMSEELTHMNLTEEVRELAIPVFLFEGRYDQTAPSVLAEEFYRDIRAPYKRLVWFENSGHPPDFEEPEKFQRELTAIGDEFCREARHNSSPRPVDSEVRKLTNSVR